LANLYIFLVPVILKILGSFLTLKQIKIIIMKILYFIIFLFILSSEYTYSQCGPLIENPETIILTGTITQDINYTNKIIIIGDNQNLIVEGNINLINCKVIFNAKLIYKLVTTQTLKFYSCQLEFFGGTSIFPHNGFRAQKVQIEIVNSCLTGDYTSELLHIEEGGLKFVNNFMTITNASHIFHFRNLDETLVNEIYGNTINVTISQFHLDSNVPVFFVDHKYGGLKIGNNNQAPNFITTNAIGFRFFNLDPNNEVTIENTIFNSDLEGIRISGYVVKMLIDNCVFNGTKVGAKGIGKDRNGLANELKITNSTFNTCEIGIDIPNSHYTLIENNAFNYTKTGIFNSFSNQSFADGEITNNQFSNGEIDIHSTGAWNDLIISRNNFSGTEYGILADGDNKYVINNNTFHNSYAGSILFSNGDNENSHSQNQFNTIVGIHSLHENFGYEFMDNCFTTSGGDVYVDGSVSLMIGEETREAGNCFTKQNIPDITATGALFEYYRPDSKINTCNDPITLSNYTKKHGFDEPENPCGSSNTFNGLIYNYCNFNSKTITCAEAKILSDQLLQQINFIINSSSYTNPILKEYLRKRLGLCRFRLLKIMMRCLGDDPDGPKLAGGGFVLPTDGLMAANELKNSTNKYEQAAYIGLSIVLGMIEEATDFISTTSTSDEEMMNFMDVQLLNIAHIQQKDSFVLTTSDSLMLVQYGQKDFPLAAYARGLYYQLTGEIMYPNIPILTFDRSRADMGKEDMPFPNPFYDQLHLEYPESAYLRIVDITGKVRTTQQIAPGKTSIDTSNWRSGMYIVHVQDKTGSASSFKVIKQ
jgi:hypothetical protein